MDNLCSAFGRTLCINRWAFSFDTCCSIEHTHNSHSGKASLRALKSFWHFEVKKFRLFYHVWQIHLWKKGGSTESYQHLSLFAYHHRRHHWKNTVLSLSYHPRFNKHVFANSTSSLNFGICYLNSTLPQYSLEK